MGVANSNEGKTGSECVEEMCEIAADQAYFNRALVEWTGASAKPSFHRQMSGSSEAGEQTPPITCRSPRLAERVLDVCQNTPYN